MICFNSVFGRRLLGLGILFVIIVDATVTAAAARPCCEKTVVEQACRIYEKFDINDDGIVEIEHLHCVATAEDRPAGKERRGTVLVLVEDRLLSEATEGPDLKPALKRYVSDLAVAEYDPYLVGVSVYGGTVHQDGRTVLALRRFFQRLNQELPAFVGAVLVGNFPEACIVRQYYWRKHGNLMLHKGKKQQRKFSGIAYVRDRAELVAARSDLVLADLDGNWEDIYHQSETSLPYFIAVNPGEKQALEVQATDYEFGEDHFEDFFFVNDGTWSQEPLDEGRICFSRSNEKDLECSGTDLKQPNPLARPDIAVSRINAFHAGLRPKKNIKALDDGALLDENGRPQGVMFPKGKRVPRSTEVWEHDEVLERRLLCEFFHRNHQYRLGAFAEFRRPASVTTAFPSAMPAMQKKFPEWKDFDRSGYDLSGKGTQLLDAVCWLKKPALLRYIVAHSDPWGSTFANTPDVQTLEDACGGTPWNWTRKGRKLVPSLSNTPHKLDFAIHRTLWENKLLPDCASMYIHGGCNSISPAEAAGRRYNHPRYGHWQGAESLMFYCNGVVLMGRSKVFYDRPRGLLSTLAQGGCWGDAWRRYFEIESAAEDVSEVGGGIGRKRSYFWSLLGDWTLTVLPE